MKLVSILDSIPVREEVFLEDDCFAFVKAYSSDVLFIMDEQLKYRYISPSVIKLRGVDALTAMRETPDQIYAGDSYTRMIKLFTETCSQIDPARPKQVFIEKINVDLYTKVEDSPQGIVHVESTVKMLVEYGKIKYIAGVSRDVTDVINSKKLEGILEMAGATCHEFAQPAQALVGFMDLLLMELDNEPEGPLKTKVLSYVARMKTSGDRMIGVLQNTQKILKQRKYTVKAMKNSKTVNNIVDISEV